MTDICCTHEYYITAYMYVIRNKGFWGQREEKESKPVAYWCTVCGAFQALDDSNPGPVEWRLPSNAIPYSKGE